MLAPPGYAKIVSTPSRSRHATRISLPVIVGPSSPDFERRRFNSSPSRAAVALVDPRSSVLVEVVFLVVSLVLLILLVQCLADPGRGNKKPTTVSSRGFLSKTLLVS